MAWTGGDTVFFNLDDALFTDAAASGTVNITGSVEPGTLTVNNDTVAYSFGGAGSIDGATSLLKEGPGMLAIATTNTFSGGTLIKGGIVEVTAVDALGTGTVTISSGLLRQPQPFGNLIINPLVLGDSNSGTDETVVEYAVAGGAVLDMPTIVSGDAPNSKAIIRAIGTTGSGSTFAGNITLQILQV